MNMMSYKGYAARIEYSEDDECFVGHISGISDIVGFHGDSVSELRDAFEEAVDDYLETCKALKRQPQQPYTGKIELRIPPDVHAGIAVAAEISGKTIDEWAEDALTHALDAPH